MATGVLHRAPTPSLIGGAWAGAECAGPGTPNPNMKGQGHLSHETQPQPRSAQAWRASQRARGSCWPSWVGVFPATGVGASLPLHPSRALGEHAPLEPAPQVHGLRASALASTREASPCLSFTFSDDETGCKNGPCRRGAGVRWGGGAGGAGGAALHLVSPFCLNIMPRPD